MHTLWWEKSSMLQCTDPVLHKYHHTHCRRVPKSFLDAHCFHYLNWLTWTGQLCKIWSYLELHSCGASLCCCHRFPVFLTAATITITIITIIVPEIHKGTAFPHSTPQYLRGEATSTPWSQRKEMYVSSPLWKSLLTFSRVMSSSDEMATWLHMFLTGIEAVNSPWKLNKTGQWKENF